MTADWLAGLSRGEQIGLGLAFLGLLLLALLGSRMLRGRGRSLPAVARLAPAGPSARNSAIRPRQSLPAPGPKPAAGHPVRDSTEVFEVDPLEEAAIFISYGHLQAAANLLHWHVQASPGDEPAYRQLLDLYLELQDEASYAELLEDYVERRGLGAAAEVISNGLLQFPENLLIQRLALELSGAEPESLEALRQRAPAAEELPGPAAAAGERAPAMAVAEPLPEDLRTLPPARGPLVEFQPGLAALTPLERHALGGFPQCQASAELGSQAAPLVERALHWAVSEDPLNLRRHVELLTQQQRNRDLDGCTRSLWRLFWVMEERGEALRRRLLGQALALGRNRTLAGLERVLRGRMSLQQLADQLGLAPWVLRSEREDCPLVRPAGAAAGPAGSGSVEDKLLGHVAELIHYSQVEEAMATLERALFRDPEQPSLYRPLLELYVHGLEHARFYVFQDRILAGDVQPPLEAIMSIIDAGERMRARVPRTGTG